MDTEDEIRPGDVVVHFDGAGSHKAIVLKVKSDPERALCLFFTSSPNWGVVSRRATREEIALVGLVERRETYLASAIRPLADLNKVGLTFPEHRVPSLLMEFYQERPG